MRLLGAFVGHELRTQGRSLRFRAVAVLYVAAGSLPAVLVHVFRPTVPYAVGSASYIGEVMNVLPLLTAVLAFLLSLDGVTREQGEGAWTTITLTGMSNAGYLLRRWLALQAVILPLTAVPVLAAAGLAMADGAGTFDARVFAGSWLLQIAPLALLVSAFALGAATIGGGPLGALPLLAVMIALVPLLGNELLHRFRLQCLGSPLEWTDWWPVTWTVSRVAQAFQKKETWGWLFPMPMSEAGFDFRVTGVQDALAGASLAGMAAALLGTATIYLRRTRPDVRPRRVRADHPFRSSLVAWGRFRERYTPDPSPCLADRAAVAAGLVVAATILGLVIARAYHYEDRAAERFAVETQGSPVPTPTAVIPGRWRVRGRLGPGSQVALEVAGEVINTGRQPAGHLAFQLNPDLTVAVTAASGSVAVFRSWDRLGVDLRPPIPAGGRRELRFRLSGEPALTVFPMPSDGSFQGNYLQHRDAKFSRDRLDFSRSYRVPAISGVRVDLAGADLVPLPRYGAWKGKGGPAPETVFPLARVELDLEAPAGLFLADSCGGVARDGGRLASRCRLPLGDLTVAGGRMLVLAGMPGSSAGTTVAVFPAHREAAELHLGFLARSAGMFEEAWPGVGEMGRMTVVERPAPEVHDRLRGRLTRGWYRDLDESFVTVAGRLVFLEEGDLILMQGLEPERLVAEILAVRLAGRRRIVPEQDLFFRQLFRTLALQRLGLGPDNGAVVGPLHPSYEPGVQVPALGKGLEYSYALWRFRFPAFVKALEIRMGEEPLRAAVEELLARGDDPAAGPASAEELFALLERHSPRPVGRLLRDALLDGGLPSLGLEGVRFQHTGRLAGEVWRVTGRVVNDGKGEAICKVVLTTDLGPESVEVRTDTGTSAAFELATRHRPQGVFLDPDQECHRIVHKGAPRDRVYFEGGAT